MRFYDANDADYGVSDTWLITDNYHMLGRAIACARLNGVEVDESVTSLLDVMKARYDEIIATERAEKARKECELKWQRLCENGCGRCASLRYDIDIPICAVTGEVLEEVNKPSYDGNNVFRLFCYAAMPSNSCPHNPNNN
jgi:hypothetical protein